MDIISFDTVTEFSNWVFEKNDERILLAICIPFAVLLDSQFFIGPGIAYYTSDVAPSFFIEGGIGYSSIQSVANDFYIVGVGFFSGLGVEITNEISISLRLLWVPAFAHSQWTPSKDNFITIVGFIYF